MEPEQLFTRPRLFIETFMGGEVDAGHHPAPQSAPKSERKAAVSRFPTPTPQLIDAMKRAQGIIEAQTAKADALAKVEAHANSDWMRVALNGVQMLAINQRELTTDDLWKVLSYTDVSTSEPRALGAVMQKAAKLGYIEPTGRYVQSTRPACHQRPIAVWKSKIYRGDANA